MKRIFCLIFAMLFVLPLVACTASRQEDVDRIQQLSDEITQMKAGYEAEIDALEAEIAALESDKAEKEAALAQLETENAAGKAELEALKASSEDEINGLETEIAALEANKAEKEAALAKLETENAAGKVEIEALTQQIAESQAQINQLKSELNKQVEETEALIAGYEERIIQLKLDLGMDPVTDRMIVDMEGYNYKAYVRSEKSGNPGFLCEDFWAEESATDALSYAVYTRNTTIESRYNCVITQELSTTQDMVNEMSRFLFNQVKYDLSILDANSASVCSIMGLLEELSQKDNIDLTHEAYDQNAVQQLSVGNELFFVSGDMNISTMDTAAVTVFNSALFDTYDFVEMCGNESFDNLYEMVADGTWSVDSMLQMAEAANVRVATKAGTMDAIGGDIVGYHAISATPLYYWYGCGARISENTADGGYPAIVFGKENGNSEEIYNFLFGSINNEQSGKRWLPNGNSLTRNEAFFTGNVLFADALLWDVRKAQFRENEKSPYGILPTPKYSAEQEDYHDLVYWSHYNKTSNMWAIPKANQNLENATYLFHVMAVYSSVSGGTMDAYYDAVLHENAVNDELAYNTLQIVQDSLTYDIFLLYDWGDFITQLIEEADTTEDAQYAEKVTEENMKKAETGLKEFVDRIKMNP